MRTSLKESLFFLFPAVFTLLFIAFPCVVFGHRVDEYLQATLVVVEPDCVRLQMNLTPGVAVADRVLSQIDTDHDGTISTNEAAAYCEQLKRDVIVEIDQRALKLNLVASYFPGLDELHSGWGFIQMEFAATHRPFSAGTHKVAIENRHLTALSVYLLNAAQPASSSIQITRQTRNENQSVGQIQLTVHSPAGSFKVASFVSVLLIVLVAIYLVATLQQPSKPAIA